MKYKKMMYMSVSVILASVLCYRQDSIVYGAITDVLFHQTTDPGFRSLQEDKLATLRNSITKSSNPLETIEESEDLGEPEKQSYYKWYVGNLIKNALNDDVLKQKITAVSAQQKIDALEKEMASTQKEYDLLNISFNNLSDDEKKTITQLSTLRTRLLKSQKSIAEMKKTIIGIQVEFAQETKHLEDTVADLAKNKVNLAESLEFWYKMQGSVADEAGTLDTWKMLTTQDNMAHVIAEQHLSHAMRTSIQELLVSIEDQEADIVQTMKKLDEKKGEMETQMEILKEGYREFKKDIISYQNLLESIKSEKKEVESDIFETQSEKEELSKEIASTTAGEYNESIEESLTSTFFDFPVEGKISRLTAFFEDEGYHKHFGFNHQAVDVPLPQGSKIIAPADGYVVKVINQDTSALNRFILVHEHNLATVYLHMSDVVVNEGDVVSAGDLIGYSGGAPGARGSGVHTTGPHLHREVWKHGKIVDPLLYTDLHSITSAGVLQNIYKTKWTTDR